MSTEPEKKLETTAGTSNTDKPVTPAAAANSNAPDAPVPPIVDPATAALAPKKYGTGRKILSISFNIAAGFAAAAAAKTIVAIPMAMMSAPAVATLLVSSFAVGAAMTAMCHAGQTISARKKGLEGPKFWTKQNRNTFLKSSGFALIGGALFMGFGEGLMDRFFGTTPDVAPQQPMVVAPDQTFITAPDIHADSGVVLNTTPDPVITHAAPQLPVPDVQPDTVIAVQDTATALPAAIPCPSPMESFAGLIDGHTVSDRVTDAMTRAASDSAKVAAQGTKDLAYFAFNGFDGVPKDPSVAAGLFQQAAEAGNVQAKIDLLYMQFHGLGGVTANPDAAISAMNDIATPRAELFVQQWGGAEKITERVAFDAKAILAGVKLCPTP